MYNYDYLYAFIVGFGILAFILFLIMTPILIVFIIARWKLFVKAGKNGWEAIIPFYNEWIYVEIAGLEWWWFLLLVATSIVSVLSVNSLSGIASLVALFASFVCNYNISKKFHKDTSCAILITIFPFIMIPIMAFSKEYIFDNNVRVSKCGPFGSDNKSNYNSNNSYNNTTSNDNGTSKFCSNCGNRLNKNENFCGNCGKEII